MAISADINMQLLDLIYGAYYDAEVLMLQKVSNRIQRGLNEYGSVEARAREIQTLKRELKELLLKVKRTKGINSTTLVQRAYELGILSANEDFGSKLPLPKRVPNKILRLAQEYQGILANVDLTILRKTSDVYRNIQAEIALSGLTNVETKQELSQRMLNKFADKGVTGFVDKLGRNWGMSSYVDMATRTVTARASIQGHIDRQKNLGRDLIIVLDHPASCPICAKYQNKVLSLSGAKGYTSYKEAESAGLFHPRCKHSVTGYIEGLTDVKSVPYVPEQYEMQQQQRANEKNIRKWKKREAVAITPKDKQLASSRVKELQGEQRGLLKDFNNKFGITLGRRYDREAIDMSKITKPIIPTKAPAPIVKGNWGDSEYTDSLKAVDKRLSKLQTTYPVSKETLSGHGDWLLQQQKSWDESLILNAEDYMKENAGATMEQAKSAMLKAMNPRPVVHEFGLGGEYFNGRIGINTQSMGANMPWEEAVAERVKSLERYAERVARGYKQRSLSVVAGGNEAVMVHEYGHAFMKDLDLKRGSELHNYFHSLTEDEISVGVSSYASTNVSEFFAECFLESYMPDPRPVAVKTMEIVKGLMK